MNDIRRFEKAIEIVNDHWLWRKSLTHDGYGQFSIKAKVVRAHRWAYEYFKGPIPEGFHVHHTCSIEHCVNPAHLQLIDAGEHSKTNANCIMTIKAKQQYCINGHERTPENTYTTGGRKRCKLCQSRSRHKFYINYGT